MFRYGNAGQHHDLCISNKHFRDVVKSKYLLRIFAYDCDSHEVKGRLNSVSACICSFATNQCHGTELLGRLM